MQQPLTERPADLEKEQAELKGQIERERDNAHRIARRLGIGSNWLVCGSLFFATLAILGGFVAGIPDFAFLNIKTWELSLATTLAIGLETLRRRLGLRNTSNEYFAHYDILRSILRKFNNEMNDVPASERLSTISKEYGVEISRSGDSLKSINAAFDNQTIRDLVHSQH
jgi:hypothetical protein